MKEKIFIIKEALEFGCKFFDLANKLADGIDRCVVRVKKMDPTSKFVLGCIGAGLLGLTIAVVKEEKISK